MTRGRFITGLLGMSCCVTSGCYTSSNTVYVAKLKTSQPVSASPAYVDAAGSVVHQDRYVVVQKFRFAKTVTGARHGHNEAVLHLDPDLERLLTTNNGDAVTNLRISATSFDTGNHHQATFFKRGMILSGILGGGALIGGLAVDRDSQRSVLLTSGGILLGMAALSGVGLLLSQSPTEWRFDISGQVVRERPLAVPMSVAPGAPGAPSAAEPPAATPATPPSVE